MAALTISASPLNVTATGTYYFQKQQAQHTSGVLAVSGTFTSLSFVMQGSVDGTNPFAAACIDLGTRQIITGATTISCTDSTTYAWEVPCELMSTIGISTTGPATGTAVFTFTSGSFIGLPVNATANAATSVTGNVAATGTLTITSASASAATVGRQGATNPVLQVDASTASVLTGLKIKGAGTGAGVAVSVVESGGTNNNLTIDAMGTGTITIAGTSTGAVTITPATTVTGILTSNGGITMGDAKNIVLNTTTGTKIGTATTQKLGFYNVTPVVQPGVSTDVTGFSAGAGTASKSDSVWAGASGATAYTVGGIITGLKALGLLAA